MKTHITNFVISIMIMCLSFGSFYYITTDDEFGGMTNLNGEKIESSFSHSEIIEKVLNGESVPFANYQMAEDYFNLKAQNDKTLGWIGIPNIGYFPIMYSGENYFYLKHNQYDQYDPYGALFMNKNSNGVFDYVSYIHGHTDRLGIRLGNLKKYRDKNFFNSNDPIEVFDGKYLYYFMPFTIFERQDGQGDNLQGDLPLDIKQEYINKRIEQSFIKPERGLKQLDINNSFMFLSCCAYFQGITRLDVGFYLLQKVEYDASGLKDFKPKEIELLNIFKEEK